MSKPIIVVTGATGAQGGSVVNFLLKDGGYHIRAVTRKLDSPAAQELKKHQGVDVVQADLNDVESLKKAFAGAHGVFGVTNFWECWYDAEIKQGKNIADAAKATGVKQVVWSTLDHSPVPHFESKAIVSDYFDQQKVPTTHLLTAFYYENLFKFMPPKKNEHGDLVWYIAIPATATLPSYSVADTGAWVLHAFKHPEKWLGKKMLVATEFITTKQLAEQFSKVTGKKAQIVNVPYEDFAKSGAPGAEELILNMKFFESHPESSGIRDVKLTHELYPQAHNWERFLKANQSLWEKL